MLNWATRGIKRLFPENVKRPLRPRLREFRKWRYQADLGTLALLYGTDKNGGHFYTQHYQRYFSHLRNQPIRLLEIGVGGYSDLNDGAASLRMWKRFFPKAQIVGIDLYDKTHFSEDRIIVLQCDQTDAQRLTDISREQGPFDIIIDDGSHLNEHIKITFNILFPLLKKGGFYAIEDLQTAYWPSWGAVPGATSMDFLRGLTDGLNYAERPDGVQGKFDTQITEIAFFHNLCVVRKGDNLEPSNAPDLVAAERVGNIAASQ
jgi:hypothetical protein